MSRIGRLPVPVPSGVEVTLDGQQVSVKGPKGTLQHRVADPIRISQGRQRRAGGHPSRTTSG